MARNSSLTASTFVECEDTVTSRTGVANPETEPCLPETSPNQVTELLLKWKSGDQESLQALLPLVYSELRRLARHHLRGERSDHTLQSTAQPRAHRRSDVDQDVVMHIRVGQRHTADERRPQRGREISGNGLLRPGAADVIHVEAARRGYALT